MAGREDDPVTARHAADDGEAVGGHRTRAAPELAHRTVGRQADGAPATLSQIRDPLGAHAHVPSGQLERAAQAQLVFERRQHDVSVAEVERQLGEVGRPVHVDAVAFGGFDGQAQAKFAGEERRPGAGCQHHLAGGEHAPGRDGAHPLRRRLQRKRLGARHDRGARVRRQSGDGSREEHRVQMTVLGEQEGARELALQAREEPAGLGRRHVVDARAQGAGALDVLGGLREALCRLEDLELAAVMEVPALAVAGGELVVQACALDVQRAQDGGGRPSPLRGAGGPEQPEPPCQRRARARRDVEGAGAVEHPLEPPTEHARRGQGRGVAGHEKSAVGVRAALRRAELRLLLQESHRRTRLGELERAAGTDRAAADNENLCALVHGLPLVGCSVSWRYGSGRLRHMLTGS